VAGRHGLTWKTDLIELMVVKVECAEKETLVAALRSGWSKSISLSR